jgi:hypothetical protein
MGRGEVAKAGFMDRHNDERHGNEKRRERLAFERFIERSLHEAYADTLRQKVPVRFAQLLDRLNGDEADH